MGVLVKEKQKGEWWVFINHQGKRKAKKIGRDKRLAQEVAKKIEAKLALGEFSLDEKKSIPTFGEYASRWIATTVPATCKMGTLRNYQLYLKKWVLPAFGKMLITEVNRIAIKEFLMDIANRDFSNSMVRNLKNILSGVMGLAVDEGVIPFNPSHRLGKGIKSKPQQLSVEPLTREELTHLLNIFEKHYPEHYPMALTLARTGMRIGEVLALQWGDIDFNGRFISIQRSFSRYQLGTPKSGKSRRVDMSKQLTEILLDLLKQRKEKKLREGWKEFPEWVFINSKGKPLRDTNWREKVFDRALAKAGMRKIRVHDLRHTYASLLIQNGESLAYVKEQMGHSSIKITVDVYGHLAPRGNQDAVNRLDDDATIRNPGATKKLL